MLTQMEFEKQINRIISALTASGYDAYAQLTGYLQTGEDTYITRNGNARAIIKTLDKEQIFLYVEEHFKQV